MPKKVPEMTTTELNKLTNNTQHNTTHSVGGCPGLLIQITPTNSKSWILRTTVDGKRRPFGLGGYPGVPLSEARKIARGMLQQIKQGIDPGEVKKQAKIEANIPTFETAALEYIEQRIEGVLSGGTVRNWKNAFRDYVYPVIGDLPVNEIELPHIRKIFDPIWQKKPSLCKKLRGRVESILSYCALHGHRSNDNPARWSGYLSEIYPSPTKLSKTKHHSALPYEKLPGVMAALREAGGRAEQALEFLILTVARSGEVIGKNSGDDAKAPMVWSEVDLKKKLWTIPDERMKNNLTHKIPLSPRAVELLKQLQRDAPDKPVFVNDRGVQPHNNYLLEVCKLYGIPTVHGLRSSFKEWARRTAYADEVSELALSHVESDSTRAAYARDELLDIRTPMMLDWEQFLSGKTEI